MRHLLLIAAVTICATPAFASSIEIMAPVSSGNGSVLAMSCADCPALKKNSQTPDYVVPSLERGTQKLEIVDQGGEQKLLRTESWMGGSPVVHVSRTSLWTPAEDGRTLAVAADVDREAKTAAVGGKKLPVDLDTAGFDLRLK